MKVKYLEKFYVAGITTRTNNKMELDETTAQIPKLWQRYVDENIESKHSISQEVWLCMEFITNMKKM